MIMAQTSVLSTATTALIIQLAQSQPALALTKTIVGGEGYVNESFFSKTIPAYIAEAKRLNVAPEHWFFYSQYDDRFYKECMMQHAASSSLPTQEAIDSAGASAIAFHESHKVAYLTSLMSCVAEWPHSTAALELLHQGGASILGNNAFMNHKRLILHGLELIQNLTQWAGFSMGAYNASKKITQANRSTVLKNLLSRVDLTSSDSFVFAKVLFNEVIGSYELSAARSSKTSQGLLGAAEVDAKASSGILLQHQESLLKLAEYLDVHREAEAATAGSSFSSLLLGIESKTFSSVMERLNDSLTDASARFKAKNAKGKAAVNPTKIKKELTADEKESLIKLIDYCSGFTSEQRIATLFSEASWLKNKPQAACITMGRKSSLMEQALYKSNLPALLELEKLGANIWLAAAQSGHSNPFLWSVLAFSDRRDHKKPWTDEMVQCVSRLMMAGAWLDDPNGSKERVIGLLDKAAAHVTAKQDLIYPLLRRLQTFCESITLEEAIAHFPKQTSSLASEASGSTLDASTLDSVSSQLKNYRHNKSGEMDPQAVDSCAASETKASSGSSKKRL